MSDDFYRVREIGVITRALYIALGSATLIDDYALIAELKRTIQDYRNRTREILTDTPEDL